MTTLAFIEGLLSPTHLIFFGLVALLLFGRRLPEVGRGLGKGIAEFKKGLKDVGEEQPTQDPYAPQQTQRYQELPPQQSPSARLQQPGPATNSGVRVSRRDMVD